ncbi:MAG: transglutaminase-like domain-containing protein [Alphaproteobacteria bacterium]|nr:transglutaminase-like domain-containing protein [Alphaproteobacteria bacterium]
MTEAALAWAREHLKRLAPCGDDEMDLGEAALALAVMEQPAIDLDGLRRHIAVLIRDVGEEARRQPDSVAGRVDSLRAILCRRFGYRGDRETYDDLRNARLPDVIERRRGLPVALGLLFLTVGRAQGWPMAGLAFPGHFLIRLDGPDGRIILDPFHEAETPDAADLLRLLRATQGEAASLRPEHYRAVPDRAILLRLQTNLKLRLISTGAVERAVGILDAMLLFAPDIVDLWRESALLNGHLGNLTAALAAANHALTLAPDATSRLALTALIQQLRARLN